MVVVRKVDQLALVLQSILLLLHLVKLFVVVVDDSFVRLNLIRDSLTTQKQILIVKETSHESGETLLRGSTWIRSSRSDAFVWSFSRSARKRRICSSLSRMALLSDLSSFPIHLSLSSFDWNWLPRPCFAYNSLRRCSACASLKEATNHMTLVT